MPTTKVNLYQMVDLAVGTPEVGAVNFNVLNTLLHAILRRLNIVDVQADLNDFDRDSLSVSKARELSVLSDVAIDSLSRIGPVDDATDRSRGGPVDDAEDALGEKLESITSFHSNKHLYEEKPIGEMCLSIQPVSGAGGETNENVIAKCMSMIEDLTREMQALREQMDQIKGLNIDDLMKKLNEMVESMCMSMIEDMTREMQALRDERKEQMDQIKGLNIDDLMKRLNGMEKKSMNEMNDEFNTLPFSDDNEKFVTPPELEDALPEIKKDLENKLLSHDDFEQFVTSPGLEDASQCIKQSRENLQQPTERVVIKISSPTDDGSDPVLSRPTSSRSSRSVTQDASPGPSGALLEILEKLGKFGENHELLTRRVEELEAENEMKKKLDQGASDGLNASSELLEQPQELKEQVDALAAAREKDKHIDKISEPSVALEPLAPPPAPRLVTSNDDLFLPQEKEMHNHHMLAITSIEMKVSMLEDRLNLIQDMSNHDSTRWESKHGTNFEDHDAMLKAQNANRDEIKKLFAYCDELQVNKADKTEVDVKADKKTLDNKVNHSLLDLRTNDISQMIKEILDKMAVNEEAWNQQCKVYSDDIDGKLDRLELDPLKEWLQSRLQALNDKLKKQNQAPVEWVNDDAAGIRRQLIQKYNCISCDRPIDIVPTGSVPSSMSSVSNHQALPSIRSPRPHLTFEMDQIRQHARSFANADYYARNRACGGQHTTTYPHQRLVKLSHLSDIIMKENEDTNVYPLFKKVVDVQGADGNIYKGRMNSLEGKLPPATQTTLDPSSMQRRDKSAQQPMRPKVMREAKPSSVKMLHSPSPPPKNGSPPQSPHQTISLQAMAESSDTTPCQSPMPQEIISVE